MCGVLDPDRIEHKTNPHPPPHVEDHGIRLDSMAVGAPHCRQTRDPAPIPERVVSDSRQLSRPRRLSGWICRTRNIFSRGIGLTDRRVACSTRTQLLSSIEERVRLLVPRAAPRPFRKPPDPYPPSPSSTLSGSQGRPWICWEASSHLIAARSSSRSSTTISTGSCSKKG